MSLFANTSQVTVLTTSGDVYAVCLEPPQRGSKRGWPPHLGSSMLMCDVGRAVHVTTECGAHVNYISGAGNECAMLCSNNHLHRWSEREANGKALEQEMNLRAVGWAPTGKMALERTGTLRARNQGCTPRSLLRQYRWAFVAASSSSLIGVARPISVPDATQEEWLVLFGGNVAMHHCIATCTVPLQPWCKLKLPEPLHVSSLVQCAVGESQCAALFKEGSLLLWGCFKMEQLIVEYCMPYVHCISQEVAVVEVAAGPCIVVATDAQEAWMSADATWGVDVVEKDACIAGDIPDTTVASVSFYRLRARGVTSVGCGSDVVVCLCREAYGDLLWIARPGRPVRAVRCPRHVRVSSFGGPPVPIHGAWNPQSHFRFDRRHKELVLAVMMMAFARGTALVSSEAKRALSALQRLPREVLYGILSMAVPRNDL